jgi:pimeloyl-ACP methyl ester carboxylesterase
VRALALYAAVAQSVAAPGEDWPNDARGRADPFERMIERWGTGALLDDWPRRGPASCSCARGLRRLERLSSSPGEVRRAARELTDFDVSEHLDELRVPTLILHRMGDHLIDGRHARYLADRIPRARYVELDVAARGAALAAPGEILASGTVLRHVVGAGVRFKDSGTHQLRDVPGRWPLFGVL